MNNIINVYCDESCHLENDGQKCMVLGAVWVDQLVVGELSRAIKEIKHRHGIKPHSEIKWTGVSPAKLDYYRDLINFFFDHKALNYRGLIVKDKGKLDHKAYNQTHDEFYYKMYFVMLKQIWQKSYRYNVYIDVKDTNGAKRVKILHDVLCNNSYDFAHDMINRIQLIRSHESAIMQLTDLISGAIAYANRDLSSSQAKLDLVRLVQLRSEYSLKHTTYLTERKFNLLVWDSEGRNS